MKLLAIFFGGFLVAALIFYAFTHIPMEGDYENETITLENSSDDNNEIKIVDNDDVSVNEEDDSETFSEQRESDVATIADAISIYITGGENLDDFPISTNCSAPSTIGNAEGLIHLETVLVNSYLSRMPSDPQNGNEINTGYTICKTLTGKFRISSAIEKSIYKES